MDLAVINDMVRNYIRGHFKNLASARFIEKVTNPFQLCYKNNKVVKPLY
jgi:hypothetical protein